MLENLLEVFTDKFRDPIKAWDKMIDYIAVNHKGELLLQLEHKFEWLFNDKPFLRSARDSYDHELLKSDYYDHLGDLYFEKTLDRSHSKSRPNRPIPARVAQIMAEMNIASRSSKPTILDPAVGTGRYIMAIHRVTPEAICFGVDNDLRSLRIAIANLSIHNIEAYLLHADVLKHEIDIAYENGRHNWQYADKWYSNMNKLKPISKSNPNRKRLKHWTNQQSH